MKETIRTYHVDDVDIDIEIVETSRKQVLSYLDNLIDCIDRKDELWKSGRQYMDNIDVSEMCVMIAYKDGTEDYINEEYDGHKIRRTNISGIVYDDEGGTSIYGNYTVNEWGVVTPE